MKYIILITLIFLSISCTTVASNIGKKLPKKLESAKIYQVSDSTWNDVLKAHENTQDFLVNNSLDLDMSYNYMNNQINSIIKHEGEFINFFQDEETKVDSIEHVPILKKTDKNVLILTAPNVQRAEDEDAFSMSIKYYMKKSLIDAGIFTIPVEKSGLLEFSFAPEIRNNILSLNTKFVRAEGGILDAFSSFAFRGFINLFLSGLNDFEIPPEYLEAQRIQLSNSPVKLGYKIYNLNALVHSFNEESMKYKINSDFSLFFNDSGFVETDTTFQPTLSLDINVIQSAIDQIMEDRNHKLVVKGDTLTNDFFYFDSIAVVSNDDKIFLHTRYKGKIPLTIFDYGIDGELDMSVHPIILNNKMYLKFEKFIFYGEQRETDVLSQILNILISETIQKTLFVDLNDYLPDYGDVLPINESVQLQNIQALFTKGMVRDGKIYIFSKLSAMLKFN